MKNLQKSLEGNSIAWSVIVLYFVGMSLLSFSLV
jgi:hypothetical protein